MPLQGDRFAHMITQGAALGCELLPFQGVLLVSFCPGLRVSALSGRAACVLLPWAKSFCPFRACGEKLAKLESFLKENVPLNTPMYPYVPTANSGCRNFAL